MMMPMNKSIVLTGVVLSSEMSDGNVMFSKETLEYLADQLNGKAKGSIPVNTQLFKYPFSSIDKERVANVLSARVEDDGLYVDLELFDNDLLLDVSVGETRYAGILLQVDNDLSNLDVVALSLLNDPPNPYSTELTVVEEDSNE